MKKVLLLFGFLAQQIAMYSQCSICTKTASQVGDKAAAGLNLSILFLAFTPIIIIGILGYRWYKSEKYKEK